MTATAEPTMRQSITLPQGYLKRALPVLKRAIGRYHHIPILANALVVLDRDELSITVTDLEIRATYTEEVQDVCGEFKVTIPFAEFAAAVKDANEVMVTITEGQDRVGVRTDIGNRELFTLPASDYPAGTALDGTVVAEFTASFKEIIPHIITSSKFASDDTARGSTLMGTYLDGTHKALKIVSTDGYRMLVQNTELATESKFKAILPHSLASVLASLKPQHGGHDVTFTVYQKGVIRIQYAGFDIHARLVDGQYPNYAAVVPKYTGKTPMFIVDRKALIQATKAATHAAGDRASMVRFGFGSSSVDVTAHSDVSGTFQATVPCRARGNSLTVAFNGAFLVETLNAFDAENLEIEVGSPLHAAIIRDGDDLKRFAIIMPLRQ